jgi:hypothetical protein
MATGRTIIYRDASGDYRWRGTHHNGKIVATSGEGYVDPSHAEAMAYRYGPQGFDVLHEKAPEDAKDPAASWPPGGGEFRGIPAGADNVETIGGPMPWDKEGISPPTPTMTQADDGK